MTIPYPIAPNDEWKASGRTTDEDLDELSKMTKAQLLDEVTNCKRSLRATRKYIGQQETRHEDRAKLNAEMEARNTRQYERITFAENQVRIEQQRFNVLLEMIKILIATTEAGS